MGRYLAQLDGIRFLAIIPVLMFHLPLPGFSLGWSGVQLFFVLSGFLISGILLDSREDPHYFRNFYARRALRIFPIYYLGLGVLVVGGLATGQAVSDAPWYLFYLQNHLLGQTNFSPDFPLLFNHTWSLAIEEQFYFLWPLAVRLLPRRALTATAFALLAVGAISRMAFLAGTGSTAMTFTSLPTEVDALAAGALLAILQRSGLPATAMQRVAAGCLVIGGAGIGAFVARSGIRAFWAPSGWLFAATDTLLWSALAVFFTGGLAHVLAWPSGRIAGILRWRPLVHVGKISYGLYLYHFPVFLLVNNGMAAGVLPDLPRPAHVALKLVLTYAVALASFRWIESRFLALKDRFI